MRQFTTGDLNKQIGDVMDAAVREPVVLTKCGKARFVLMSYEHYERMRTGGDPRRAAPGGAHRGRSTVATWTR